MSATKDPFPEEEYEEPDAFGQDEIAEHQPDVRPDLITADVEVPESVYQPPMPGPHWQEPRRAAIRGRKTYRTGPKGVLTDYNEAQLKMRARRYQEKIDKSNNVYMHLDTSNDIHNPIPSHFNNEKSDQKTEDGDNDKDSDFESEMDKDALLLYKMSKMKIMDSVKARYGSVKEVTAWTFSKEVDEAPQDVWVVIHMYQDYIEECVQMNNVLSKVAQAYPHIKFLRGRADFLGMDSYPDVGLPTFIIFKNGKQLHNCVAVLREMSSPLNPKNVEKFLIEKKIITTVKIPEKSEFIKDNSEISDDIFEQQNTMFSNSNKNKSKSSKPKGVSIKSSHYRPSKKSNTNNDDSEGSELDID